jgi:hypothetical protein
MFAFRKDIRARTVTSFSFQAEKLALQALVLEIVRDPVSAAWSALLEEPHWEFIKRWRLGASDSGIGCGRTICSSKPSVMHRLPLLASSFVTIASSALPSASVAANFWYTSWVAKEATMSFELRSGVWLEGAYLGT